MTGKVRVSFLEGLTGIYVHHKLDSVEYIFGTQTMKGVGGWMGGSGRS